MPAAMDRRRRTVPCGSSSSPRERHGRDWRSCRWNAWPTGLTPSTVTGLVRLSTYRGRSGIISLLPRLASDNAGLVTIYNDMKSAYVQFWRGVFERCAPLSIRAVEAAAGTELKQGNWTPISHALLDALTRPY
jgi:hypothetical protein